MTSPTVPHQSPQQAPAARDSHTWVLWLLLMASLSLLVAVCVGILESLRGAGLAEAVLSGGKAFGGSIVICLTAVVAVRELRRSR